MLAAKALARKLKPVTIPEASEDQSSEAAGRSISSLAGSRMLSWISTAERRVPDSGVSLATSFLPFGATVVVSKARPCRIGKVQPLPGNCPGPIMPGEADRLERGKLARDA